MSQWWILPEGGTLAENWLNPEDTLQIQSKNCKYIVKHCKFRGKVANSEENIQIQRKTLQIQRKTFQVQGKTLKYRGHCPGHILKTRYIFAHSLDEIWLVCI